MKITLTAEAGTTPSIGKTGDGAAEARVESAFAPKAEAGQTVYTRHLLLKIGGSGRVNVRIENAKLRQWKQEAGDSAAVNAVVVRVDSSKTEKTGAAVRWEANEISFDAGADTVVDIFLTAVITETPTEAPIETPTPEPMETPTPEPTEAPTEAPTETPTPEPTEAPTEAPTEVPTEAPTETPTEVPIETPTSEPTEVPTETPTEALTEAPTETPTEPPTEEPTEAPTEAPTEDPTPEPTDEPALEPTPEPVAFSQYAVVDGVKISVSAAPGVFPAGARLSVSRVTAVQQAQVDRAIDRAQDDRTQVAVSYSFDIKILDENGNELQPAEGQTVNVSFSLAEVANDNLQTTVYHMEEQANGTLNAEKLSAEEAGQTVTAQSDGFSVYTVTFTYEERQFSVLADSTIAVSDVVSAVGLTGTPTEVALANSPEEGKGLSLTGEETNRSVQAATQSASAEQKLTVTLQGVDFEILLAVSEQKPEDSALDYLDDNGNKQTWTGGYTVVQGATWQEAGGLNGWYVVSGDITLEQRVMVYGNVKLVLADGATLKANGGIQVSPGSGLTIYCQSGKTGALMAVSREPAGNLRATGAAIGGAYSTQGKGDAGKIRIVGGVITATSGAPGCAGIGGGTDGVGTVTIDGGSVKATGCGNGDGIGGKAAGTVVAINHGSVTAKGGDDGGVGITGRTESTVTEDKDEEKKKEAEKEAEKDAEKEAEKEAEKDPNKIYAPDGSVYNPDNTDTKVNVLDEDGGEDPRKDYYDADAAMESISSSLTPTADTGNTGVRYAPDGSVYTPTEIDENRVSTGENAYANLRTEYYNEAVEKMYSPRKDSSPTVTASPNAVSVKDGEETEHVNEPVPTTEEKDWTGKNVILVSLGGTHENSEVLPALRRWGIVYSNHTSGKTESNTVEDILAGGLENGTAETAEDLLGAFGYALVMSAPGEGLNAPDDRQIVNEVVSWILSEGRMLNAAGRPYFIGLRLNGEKAIEPMEEIETGPGMDPATPTDLGPASPDEQGITEVCLENLVNSLRLNALLSRTVIILLNEADGEAIIIHPNRGGLTVTEETADRDILSTVLMLAIKENRAKEDLPEILQGIDMLGQDILRTAK